MRIIIVGCGKIGQTILKSLVAEKHEVLAIDSDPAVVREVSNAYDVMAVCGNGTEYGQLKQADVEKADLFIAATGSDELNMLSCFAAKRMGAKYTVARIRNNANNDEPLVFLAEQLELSMAINPDRRAAMAIYNVLKLPSATKVETFGSSGFEMIELPLKADSPLDGVKLMELRKKVKGNFLICAVGRGDEVYIPKGNFALKGGDRIGLIASEEDTPRLFKAMGVPHKQVRDVIIMGASRIAGYLTEQLLRNRISVKIIEIDREKCEEFCERFPAASVICGDGTDQELLKEEGLEGSDAFVALTGKDEENILISFYSMSQKVKKVISKVNREELSALAGKLGLECIVSTKNTTAEILVRYARALQSSMGSKMETLYSLMNGKAEAAEFVVMQDFPHANVPLKNLSLKKDVLIAGIVRGKDEIIPAGDDVILTGDRVIVIGAGRVADLADVIEG